MTPDQVLLLRSGFDKLRPISEQAAALFYARLFEIEPEARILFKSPMPEQGRKLMATLASVINGIDEMHLMRPAVQNLGRRHHGYGVTQAHFVPVGVALLWMLERCLGDDFTPAARDAWLAAYTALADIMMHAE
ncbi:hemin receptor [Starkeya sp. ORNL1]|uniref:globin family protein n=1 Tax=Starkeya sp. ORNL1 TaxID=2709380 RepID=UPI001464322F|nr:globin family protein [Starkeya sp. ORNL1]QJP17116.1 hemin receptor [Starkeya sp. ORNL1]